MTKLAPARAVTRQTWTTYRGRPLQVRLTDRVMFLKELGRRDWVTVPYDAAYEMGLKLAARAAGVNVPTGRR